MAGGSLTRENASDQQCEHCKRWYSSQGIDNHQDSCPLQGVDLEEYAAHVTERGAPGPDPHEGEVASTAGTDASADTRTDARTDGSGLGLDGKPDTSPSDVGEDEDDELVCTSCEEGLEVTDDELEADDDIASGDILTCECGHEMRWVA